MSDTCVFCGGPATVINGLCEPVCDEDQISHWHDGDGGPWDRNEPGSVMWRRLRTRAVVDAAQELAEAWEDAEAHDRMSLRCEWPSIADPLDALAARVRELDQP